MLREDTDSALADATRVELFALTDCHVLEPGSVISDQVSPSSVDLAALSVPDAIAIQVLPIAAIEIQFPEAGKVTSDHVAPSFADLAAIVVLPATAIHVEPLAAMSA
jgi:hypothetical protein